MIKFSREFYKKVFVGATLKEAYMKAVKWYATNILTNKDFDNVQVSFIKDKEEAKVTMICFAVQDNEDEIFSHFCKCCREVHKSFFLNEETACNRCSALSYQRRIEENINSKRAFYKEILRKRMDDA